MVRYQQLRCQCEGDKYLLYDEESEALFYQPRDSEAG